MMNASAPTALPPRQRPPEGQFLEYYWSITGVLLECRWGDCCELFQDRAAQAAHVYSVHGFIVGTMSSACMTVWCRYCQEAMDLTRYSPERRSHFAGHLDEAVQMVRDYGYAGLYLGQVRTNAVPQEFVHCRCVFCFHDEGLDVEERIGATGLGPDTSRLTRHLKVHFDHFEKDTLLYCPASPKGGAAVALCTNSSPMTLGDAWHHIIDVHYGISVKEDDVLGQNKRKESTEENTPEPAARQKRLKKYSKSSAHSNASSAMSEQNALGEKSSNTLLKQTASISKNSDHSVIDPDLR